MSDTELLNWLEANCVDLSVVRDAKRGTRYTIDFNTNNSCVLTSQAKTLRQAIILGLKDLRGCD